MMKSLFNKSRRSRSSKPFTGERKFTHERLEPRMMLTINATGTEFLVNDVVHGLQNIESSVASVAVSETAGMLAAYSGMGGGRRESIFLRMTDLVDATDTNVVQVSSTIRGTRSNAVVAANDAGDAVVVWQGRGAGDKYGIFYRQFDSTGAAVGEEQLANQLTVGEQHDPAVAMAADGSFVITWTGPSDTDRSGVFARRFNADGTAVNDEGLVNTTRTKDQAESSISMNSAGEFLITWSSRDQDGDDWGVFAQRFNTAGESQGDEFAINTTTTDSQRESSVAMQDDGTFMAVWSSLGQDGDNWGIVGQRFDAAGSTIGDEFIVNTTTTGHQRNPQVAGSNGRYLVTWQSGVFDGSGWEVMSQEYDEAGNTVGTEQTVNTGLTGPNSGHQQHPAVDLNASGAGAIVWAGRGTTDRMGVYGRTYQDDDVMQEPNETPDLAAIPDQTATPNTEMTVTVTATDPNSRDTLTFQLDPTNSPTGATIEKTDDGSAIIRWTPTDFDQDTVVTFEVIVTDDGEPPLADSETFEVTVGDGAFVFDLNGADEAGVDDEVTHFLDGRTTSVLDSDLILAGPSGRTITGLTATITRTNDDLLEVDTTGTNISAVFSANNRRLTLSGDATAADYQRVLRTMRYSTAGFNPMIREVTIVVTDDTMAMRTAILNIVPLSVAVDASGFGVEGANATTEFDVSGGPVAAAPNLEIAGARNRVVTGATATIPAVNSGEVLEVDTLDTSISAAYESSTGVLTLSGDDSQENYQRVLRTLTYDGVSTPQAVRNIGIVVSDSANDSDEVIAAVNIDTPAPAQSLVAFAQAIAAAVEADTTNNSGFYGAAWCPACTAQKERFEDGAQFLPFIEVTNPDRSRNQVSFDNNITTFPTWVFPDGTRLEGEQSLQTLSDRFGIAIPTSSDPFVAPIADATLLVGSPLHVSLDGYDPNGGPLTYTVETDNPDVEATILSGNRSARIDVAGFGDMVFELFEQRASRPTERFIELANDDFYDGVGFHRVVNDFVIQGGDPIGTGGGGSTLGNFDDQFHVDLQHNRSGLLSYAKSSDDTNDSQFFVTEGASGSLRNLDFNHSIFGVLVEGESNRAAISDTAVQLNSSGTEVSDPVFDVTMENVEIFEDTENAVLFLKAADGVTGDVSVTVTATDQQGNTFERTFTVAVTEDTVNGRPFLGDIAPVSIARNTSAQIQLTATDVEGDSFVFSAIQRGSDYTFDINSDTGLLTVTPNTDFNGSLEIEVRVQRTAGATDFDLQLLTIEVT